MKPDLLESIDPADAGRFLDDDGWAAEEKFDGIRCLAVITDGVLTFRGRDGQELGDNRSRKLGDLRSAFRFEGTGRKVTPTSPVLPGNWVFDGELLGDGTWHVFDLCRSNSLVDDTTAYAQRRSVLGLLFERVLSQNPRVVLVESATGAEAKRALHDQVKAERGEGVIFKHQDGLALLTGRRVRTMLKCKFVSEADFVVLRTGDDGHESAALGLYRDGTLVEIGKTGIIGRGSVAPGDVIQVRFLYVGSNGRLVQPRMIGPVRTDKRPEECLISQLG